MGVRKVGLSGISVLLVTNRWQNVKTCQSINTTDNCDKSKNKDKVLEDQSTTAAAEKKKSEKRSEGIPTLLEIPEADFDQHQVPNPATTTITLHDPPNLRSGLESVALHRQISSFQLKSATLHESIRPQLGAPGSLASRWRGERIQTGG